MCEILKRGPKQLPHVLIRKERCLAGAMRFMDMFSRFMDQGPCDSSFFGAIWCLCDSSHRILGTNGMAATKKREVKVQPPQQNAFRNTCSGRGKKSVSSSTSGS